MADSGAPPSSPTLTQLALVGKRVIVTRALEQSSELSEKLTERGAVPISLPLVSFSDPSDFSPLDAALSRWKEFDWIIYTSANAVQSVVSRAAATDVMLPSLLRDRGIGPLQHPRIAAVGPATKSAAETAGFGVHHVAKTHLGVALAEELAPQLRDKSVLLPRSDRANPDLPAALRKFGARVTEVIAYRTLRPAGTDLDLVTSTLSSSADVILFFSPSAVHNLVALIGEQSLRDLQGKIVVASAGLVTTIALREHGVDRIVTATIPTTNDIILALVAHFVVSARSQKAAEGQPPISGATHG